MKQTINILLITSLWCITIYFYPNDIHQDQSHTKIKIEQSLYSLKKHAVYIAAIPILLYSHKDIINFITYRPYLSSFCFYFLINYYCDSLLSFQKQEDILALIYELKKIGLYLVIIYGIKNYIYQPYKKFNINYPESFFLENVLEDLPYSLDETTSNCLKFYYELKNYFYSLNNSLVIESEEFIFLSNPTTINLQTALYITQNHSDLHQKLQDFEKNSEIHINTLLNHIKLEVAQSFINLKKHLLKSNIQSSIIL